MKNLLLLLSLALLAGCRQQQPHAQRFLPVGNNPEIALDSQDGTLCRTVPAPLGHTQQVAQPFATWLRQQGAGREPGCAVSEEEKKLGFIPASCKSRQTWVRAVKGGSAEAPSGFTPRQKLTLNDLQDIIRVRDELRKAGDPRADRIDKFIQGVKEIEVEPPLAAYADLPLCSNK
jgi:hypothetical protein